MAAPMRTGRRVGGWRQSSHAEHQRHGDDQVGAEREGESGEEAGDASRQRRREAGSATCSPRTAKTALHRVRASAPFQAIAVRPIGVRT